MVEHIQDTNFTIHNLQLGKTWYIQVAAIKEGQEISKSPEIPIVLNDQFRPTGVDIIFDPDPPLLNYDLNINTHFYGDLEYPPKVEVRFTDGRIVRLDATGEKRDYYSTLPATEFISSIEVVDVFDHMDRKIGSRGVGFDPILPGDGPGGGDVTLDPDPPIIGEPFTINVHFYNQVNFETTAVVRFVDGSQVEVVLDGDYQDFSGILSAANFYNTIDIIDILDDLGKIIASWSGTGGDTGHEPGLGDPIITPFPPKVNLPFNIELTLPFQSPLAPKFRLKHADGTSMDFDAQGDIPGNYFYYNFDKLLKPLNSIVILDPFGNPKQTVSMPGATEVHSVNIRLEPQYPIATDSLKIFADFPDTASYDTPQAIIVFDNGGTIRRSFAEGPGLNNYEMLILATEMNDINGKVIIESEYGNFLGEMRFGASTAPDTSNIEVEIEIDPADPVPNSDSGFDVKLHFPNGDVGFTPNVQVKLMGGINRYPTVTGEYNDFVATVTAANFTNSIEFIDVKDDNGSLIGSWTPGGTKSNYREFCRRYYCYPKHSLRR